MRLLIALIIAALALAPAPSWAKGKSDHSQAGGKSAEHRSEKGVENANPQHLPDAKQGQERAEERQREHESEEPGEPEEVEEAEDAGEKKTKREGKEEAKQKQQQGDEADED